MKSADGGTLADYLSDFLSEEIPDEDKKSVCANDKTSLKPTETAGKPLLKDAGAAKTASEENLHANHRSRMIGRFLKSPDSLNDHEILEILLYFTVKRKDTNPLAHKILSYFKDLSAVFEADADTLKKIDGVGDKIASELLTISQVIKRVENIKKNSDKTEFRSLRNIKPLIDVFGSDYRKSCSFHLRRTEKVQKQDYFRIGRLLKSGFRFGKSRRRGSDYQTQIRARRAQPPLGHSGAVQCGRPCHHQVRDDFISARRYFVRPRHRRQIRRNVQLFCRRSASEYQKQLQYRPHDRAFDKSGGLNYDHRKFE